MGLTSVDPSQSLGRPSPSAEENEYSYILTSVQASLNKAITGSVILGRKIITALYHSIIVDNTIYTMLYRFPQLRQTRRLVNANLFPRQHSCHKSIWRMDAVGRPCKNFPLVYRFAKFIIY